MGAFEFDMFGAIAKRFINHQVGNQCAHPGYSDIRISTENILQRAIDAQLHQQQRNDDIKH